MNPENSSPSILEPDVVIEPATEADVKPCAMMGAAVLRMHCEWDRHRFLQFPGPIEIDYERWLRGRLADASRSVILVGRRGERIVAFLAATLEPRDWKTLADAHGYIHDLYVDPGERGHGLGEAIVRAALAELERRGARRVLLQTSARNTVGQAFFEKLGFRPTMIEYTSPPPADFETR